jgi:hypothetical protein
MACVKGLTPRHIRIKSNKVRNNDEPFVRLSSDSVDEATGEHSPRMSQGDSAAAMQAYGMIKGARKVENNGMAVRFRGNRRQ